MSKQTRKTRGGGGNRDLPPIDEALRSDEYYGTYSHGYRSVDRDQNSLPNLNRYNSSGQKSNFHDTLDDYGVDTLEPPAAGRYSSTTAGFDKYAKDRKASGGTPDYGYSGSAQGAHDFNVGYQRRQRPQGGSSRDDGGEKHSSSSKYHSSSSRHHPSSSRSGKHHSSSSCQDPKGKGTKDDDYSDDECDEAAPRSYGGTTSGSYYGSSAGGYYGSAH